MLRRPVEFAQYLAIRYTERLAEAGAVPSVGSRGDSYDNALAESFNGLDKAELLDRQAWSTRLELATALFDYLEIFHNRQRRHSSLGMLTPIEFETRQEATATGTPA